MKKSVEASSEKLTVEQTLQRGEGAHSADVWEKRALGSGTATMSVFSLFILGCTGSLWLQSGHLGVWKLSCWGTRTRSPCGTWDLAPRPGSNLCAPHWQVGSKPLDPQGRPEQ